MTSSTQSLLTLSAIAFLVGAGVTACSTETHKPTSHQVTIQQLAYSPDTITVQQGDTVVWINNDILPHTATDTIGTHWDTDTIAANGAQKALVMTEKGTANYFCALHPTMHGTIIVQ